MENSNTFKLNGINYTFCGFYEGKFAFYANGKAIFVKDIDELQNLALSD